MPAVSTIPPQPLHDTDGKVFAYFVPADQFDRLQAEVEHVRKQRDAYESKLRSLLPKATPEEEAEMQRLLETAVPNGLRNLIADLESEDGSDGRR
jgi:transketolase